MVTTENETTKRTLCYRLFNKPGNLEEALEKARENGNKVEIRIWTAKIEGCIDSHYGRIKSGRGGSFYFVPFLTSGPVEVNHKRYRHRALAAKRWFEKKRVEVNFIDKYV